MKLFHFQYNDYGSSYSVLAETKEQALAYIKQYCYKLDIEYIREQLLEYGKINQYIFPNSFTYPSGYGLSYQDEESAINQHGPHTQDYHDIVLGKNYDVIEYNVGEVLETEKS